MNETLLRRSRIMRAVKSVNTAPEIVVRSLAHRLGFRFRLHRKDLPGKPDLVFPRLHKVVFVHGCFWHGHTCPRGAREPKTNAAYWRRKIAGNQARDVTNAAALKKLGWSVLVIWECKLKDSAIIEKRLLKFLQVKSKR